MNPTTASLLVPATPSTYVFASTSFSLPSYNHVKPPTDSHDSQIGSQKPSTKRNLYSVTEDGHFVGDDGFIVPRSFEEFFERHPRYVRGRVRLRWPNVSSADREDRESELLIFLMTLPENSKFRDLGCNGFPHGCTDRIQTFSPDNAYGASKPRFFNYVRMVLTNYFNSLSLKALSDPVRRPNTLSLNSLDTDGKVIDEAYIYALTNKSGAFRINYDQAIENGILMDQFLRFVKTYNPELLEVIKAIQMTDTFVEAQHALGFPKRLFIRARNRLVVLYTCLDKGTEPPRQRKVYSIRSPRTPDGGYLYSEVAALH